MASMLGSARERGVVSVSANPSLRRLASLSITTCKEAVDSYPH